MWISFERLQLCHPQEQFVLLAPGWFTIHATVLTYLNPAQGHLLLRTCIILLIDRLIYFCVQLPLHWLTLDQVIQCPLLHYRLFWLPVKWGVQRCGTWIPVNIIVQ